MTRTRFILLLITASLIILAIHLFTDKTRVQTASVKPCSFNAPPCVQMTQHDGTIYKFNDFTYTGLGCISFVSLPDKIERDYCGDYTLDWIGEEPSYEVI